MKITVSGWAGSGSSTLSLLLADLYGINHLKGGQVFRELFKILSNSDSGKDRIAGNQLVEPYFGPIYDKYIDTLLLDENVKNLLIENDIASFRVGKKANVCSIFLITDESVRQNRLNFDKRELDSANLKNIDKSHKEEYFKLLNLDITDVNVIKSKHSLVIENSAISISQTLDIVIKEIDSTMGITPKSSYSTKGMEETFFSKGKKYFEEKNSQNLIPVNQILSEIKSLFPDEISDMPSILKNIILNYK